MSNDHRRDTWDGRAILRKAQSNGYGTDTDRDGDDHKTDVAGLTKKTTLGGGSNMEDDPDNDTSSANSINHRSSEYIANKPDTKQQRHSVLAMPSDFAFKSLVHKLPTPLELFNPENQQLDTKKAIHEIDLVNHSKSGSGSSSSEEDYGINDQGPTDEEKNKALNKFFASKTLLIGRLAEKKKQAVMHITKKTSSLFLNLGSIRDNMLLEESHFIDRLAKEGLLAELDMLDRIETNQVNVYSAIVRHRIRIINQDHDFYKKRYGPDAFDVVSVCFSLMRRSSTALGFEDEKLQLMVSTLSLVLRCMEFGLFDLSKLKEMLLCLFQKTEFINKQEEYITKQSNEFKIETFFKLMQCKSLCTGVLLQIVTALNDDWLYYYTKLGEIDYLQTRKDKRHILKNKGPHPKKDHNPFVCDIRSYSFFSFIMFNYLLKELRKDGELFSDDLYLNSMKDLVLYVYDFREDPLVLTIELVKPEYLSYYIGLNIEDDHINRANEILKLISDLKKKFTEGTAIQKDDHDSIEQLEQDIGNIFGMLEILMGLQDETYSIRLMLTEKKVPELLVELFVNMQETYIGGSGEELVIQGLKVLYQLCRGNYTGQALITKGRSWHNFKKLIKGSFSVFNILFLKQLFEDDPKYLHINQDFAIELIDLFYISFDNFFGTFAQPKPIEGANDLVALYAFKSLINLFIKTSNISLSIRRSYNLPISSKLHSMVEKFAYPLFIENYLQIHQIYEPKLLNKNWKLEDGSFLVSLMMLSGNHIKCMLVDFAYSLIKLYNKSCENYFPSEFVDGMEKSLPLDLSCFDYLMSFTEGIKFKTEIMSSYCIFRIFSQSSKIPAAYTLSELSVDGADTNVDLLPNSHLNQLPDMITSELIKFQSIHNERSKFLKEDLFDYLLRGLCQMCYKYATGITWYFLASEKDEVKVNLTHKLQAMSEAVSDTIEMVMNKEDRHAGGGQTSRSTNMLEKMTKDQQSGITNKLKDALANILISIEKMFLKGGPSYKNILKKYELNIGHDDISKLKIASSLLMCEASFLNSSKLKQKKSNQDDDVDVLKSNTEHAILIELISNYKIIKKKFLQDNKNNKFYEVLQSKMENTNQTNLISYVCHSLGSLDHSTCEYNSLWFSKTHINTIIFLNNTMYWCPKTRIKLFEYLQKNPDVQQRLIGVIYKGLRDCFSILAYGPFFNDQWEIIFSKFYIFSSFIKGLCKQNCQEFKLFLGEFIPDLHCRNHADQNTSVPPNSRPQLILFPPVQNYKYMDIELDEAVITSDARHDYWKSIKEHAIKTLSIGNLLNSIIYNILWVDKKKILMSKYIQDRTVYYMYDIITRALEPQIVLNSVKAVYFRGIVNDQMYSTFEHHDQNILLFDFLKQSLSGVLIHSDLPIPDEHRQAILDIGSNLDNYYVLQFHVSGYLLFTSSYGNSISSYCIATKLFKKIADANFHCSIRHNLVQIELLDNLEYLYWAAKAQNCNGRIQKWPFSLMITTNRLKSMFFFRKFYSETNTISDPITFTVPGKPSNNLQIKILTRHILLQKTYKQLNYTYYLLDMHNLSILHTHNFAARGTSKLFTNDQHPFRIRHTDYVLTDICITKPGIASYRLLAVRHDRLYDILVKCSLPINSYTRHIAVVTGYHATVAVEVFDAKSNSKTCYCVKFE